MDEDEKSIEVNMMNNDQMTPADLALEEEEIQMLLGQKKKRLFPERSESWDNGDLAVASGMNEVFKTFKLLIYF